ncbi:hypothetical protein [Amycolatopsis sp. MEPSY49]|uniref:hypothetical protein n=1 Tax=Amycolatopsis sp. MEPSY49 TaxID=3151600 RepID=UPI003EF4E3B4
MTGKYEPLRLHLAATERAVPVLSDEFDPVELDVRVRLRTTAGQARRSRRASASTTC